MKKWLSLSIASAIYAPQVFAQDTITLTPITVSAENIAPSYTVSSSSINTGLDLTLRETPQSVSVINAQQMQDQGLKNLKDVLKQSVGISEVSQGSGLASSGTFYARGFEINNYRIDGMSQVGMNTPSARNALSSAIYETVTVSRGANGLLGAYGHPGATIELTRKRPTKEFQSHIEIGAGSFSAYDALYDVSGGLNADNTWRGRLVLNYENVGLHAKRANEDARLIYGIMEYDLSPNTMLTFGVQHNLTQNESGARVGFKPYYGTDRTGYYPLDFAPKDNTATNWSYANRRNTQIFLGLDQQINDNWKLKAQYQYGQTKAEQVYSSVGSSDINANLLSSLEAGYISNNPKEHSLSLDLSGKLSFWGNEHPVNIGLSHTHFVDNKSPVKSYSPRVRPQYSVLNYNGDVPNMFANFVDQGRGGQRYKLSSIYASGQFNITDDLSFVLGGRYSNYYSDTKVSDANPNLLITREKGIFTPYIGITYDLNDWASVYASYSKIFNPHFGNRLGINGAILEPEIGSSVEVGAKGEWFDGRLNAAISAYEIKKDNLSTPGDRSLHPQGAFYWTTLDDTKSRGFELSLSGELTPSWHMNASYTRNKIEDKNGERIRVDTPIHQFKLFTTYQLNDQWLFGANLNWQSAIRAQNSRWTPVQTGNEVFRKANEQRAYALLDLMAQYKFNPKTTVGLYVNNIFDQRYTTAPGSHKNGAPRNFYANLRYDF